MCVLICFIVDMLKPAVAPSAAALAGPGSVSRPVPSFGIGAAAPSCRSTASSLVMGTGGTGVTGRVSGPCVWDGLACGGGPGAGNGDASSGDAEGAPRKVGKRELATVTAAADRDKVGVEAEAAVVIPIGVDACEGVGVGVGLACGAKSVDRIDDKDCMGTGATPLLGVVVPVVSADDVTLVGGTCESEVPAPVMASSLSSTGVVADGAIAGDSVTVAVVAAAVVSGREEDGGKGGGGGGDRVATGSGPVVAMRAEARTLPLLNGVVLPKLPLATCLAVGSWAALPTRITVGAGRGRAGDGTGMTSEEAMVPRVGDTSELADPKSGVRFAMPYGSCLAEATRRGLDMYMEKHETREASDGWWQRVTQVVGD